ncbi:MAG TPA: 4a-hydroxytetrahydrobiopterin dehydratase [Bacteroidia bacterium]|nr:4a-hydroxytetrahydrobiopterin dehydratase [Bacteroidia bacterium]
MWKKIEETNGTSYLIEEFEFKNFIDAFAFMSKVAFLAEKHNHHPNWSNVYNKVTIKLNTHSKGNIVTEKDEALAQAINNLL